MAKKKLTLLDKTYRAGKVYDFFKNGSVVLAIGFVTFVVLCFSLGLFTDSKIGFIGCAILSGGFLCFHRARIYFGQIEGDYFMQFMDLEGAFSEQFCRDRDAAFFSLDKEKIVAYLKKYDFQTLMEDEQWYSLNWARVIDYLERFIVFSDPKDEKGFWTEVYGVILKIDHAPENLRQQAEEWLVVHGVRLE